MEQELFEDLLASIREAGEILRGDWEPARVTKIELEEVAAREVRVAEDAQTK